MQEDNIISGDGVLLCLRRKRSFIRLSETGTLRLLFFAEGRFMKNLLFVFGSTAEDGYAETETNRVTVRF